ncbi:hypothetical protein [Aeromonas phage 32]|nr:hypothetical protein [Aeromonas phage 32]
MMAESRSGKGVRAIFFGGNLEVEYTTASSRFRVITCPSARAGAPELQRFLEAHAIGGVVTGYRVLGGELLQWFDVMPRYADDFAHVVAVCVSGAAVAPSPSLRIDRVPGGFYEALVASQWHEVDVTHHPALVNPSQVSILRHVDGHTEVIFAEGGVWLGVAWPFEPSALVRTVKAMPGVRCLVDKGPDGWHAGHWDDHGARGGVAYVKWEGSLPSLQSLLRGLKNKRKAKAKPVDEFDSHHPKPTAYSFTIH